MKIREILATLSKAPIVVHHQKFIVEAAGIMAENNIGALVVVDEKGNIKGVISERDITYALGNLNEAVLGGVVADLMTPNIVTIQPEETVEDAVYVFKAGLFRHLVVVENGKPVGVISIRDILRNLAPLLLEAKTRLDEEKVTNLLRVLNAA